MTSTRAASASDPHRQAVGSYSPTGEGKFFFTMMAAFAELERDIDSMSRTMAGLAAAKAQGRTGGRPTVMDADKLLAATCGPPPSSMTAPAASSVRRRLSALSSFYRYCAAHDLIGRVPTQGVAQQAVDPDYTATVGLDRNRRALVAADTDAPGAAHRGRGAAAAAQRPARR